MAIVNFGIVIAGVTVPPAEFDLSRCEFRGQHFKELFRAPVALQAEAPGMRLQILPDRCEFVVTAPGNIDEDVSEVIDITNSVFEYVGERVIRATGHNVQYVVDGSAGRKLESVERLLQPDAINSALGRPFLGADLTFYLRLHNESTTRVVIMSEADPSSLVLDFNINFEKEKLPARTAINSLRSSLTRVDEIATRLSSALLGHDDLAMDGK